MGITFLRNTLQTQCKTLRKPSGDVQRISSFNKREGRPKASWFLVIVLSPPRPRLRSVPAPLRFASPRNIDGRTERQYHDSTVLARACLRRRANKHHQRTNRIGDHLERLTSDANSQELCITGFNGASGCATGLASGKKT